MFIEEELLPIVIYYKKAGRHYEAYNEEDFEKMGFPEEESQKFKTLTIEARQLTWGLYNSLQEAAMVPDQLGNKRWNYKVFKENKLRKIIAKWDAQKENEKGEMKTIEITPKVISQLAPEIAETIIDTYDKKMTIDEDNEKKS